MSVDKNVKFTSCLLFVKMGGYRHSFCELLSVKVRVPPTSLVKFFDLGIEPTVSKFAGLYISVLVSEKLSGLVLGLDICGLGCITGLRTETKH